MKLRKFFLVLSLVMLTFQAPTQGFPGWATKAVSLVKNNNTVLLAAAGFGLHSIVSAYRSYNDQQEQINAQIRTLSTLRALHMSAASYPKGDLQYNHAIKQIKNIPVSNLSSEVVRVNERLLTLLEASKPDYCAIADAYSQLYKQINTELGYFNPVSEAAATLPEFIYDPNTYLSLIF